MSLVEKLFGSFSDRELKKVNPITKQVLALEPKYQAMSDADLQTQTAVFKQQLSEGKTLDDILPDAFAVCREAAWRVLGMKHFPVQVTGGIALHRGDIAEMQTGEGKTLVATMPVYLNALTGEGVHVVTVNDYLANRDAEWMGKVHRFLGLTVGVVLNDMKNDERRQQCQRTEKQRIADGHRPAAPAAKELFRKKARGYVQYIGQQQPPAKRCQQPEKRPGPAQYARQPVCRGKHRRDARRQQQPVLHRVGCAVKTVFHCRSSCFVVHCLQRVIFSPYLLLLYHFFSKGKEPYDWKLQ